MAGWIRYAPYFLVLTVMAVVANGCGWRGSPPPDPVTIRYGSLSGTLELSGPLPVYSTGEPGSPLQAGVGVGLFAHGTSERLAYTGPGYVINGDTNPNLNGRRWFTMEFSETRVPPGTYDLAVYANGAAALFPGGLTYESTPMAIQSRTPVTIDYPIDGDSGAVLRANFSGPGPWGSISGRLLLTGNALRMNDPALVLVPDSPAAGVNPETGLLWNIDLRRERHGYCDFTVEELQHGTYSVSAADVLLVSVDPDSHTSISLSPEHPSATGIDFTVRNINPGTRPYELGEIRGTLSLPAQPQPGRFLAIEADRQPDPDAEPLGGLFVYSLATFIVDSENLPDSVDFILGWLADGAYTIRIYQLADAADDEDVLLLELPDHVVIAPGSREITGLQLEVE